MSNGCGFRLWDSHLSGEQAHKLFSSEQRGGHACEALSVYFIGSFEKSQAYLLDCTQNSHRTEWRYLHLHGYLFIIHGGVWVQVPEVAPVRHLWHIQWCGVLCLPCPHPAYCTYIANSISCTIVYKCADKLSGHAENCT